MGKLGDLFQEFMALPKEVGKPDERFSLWKRVSTILETIDTMGVTDPGGSGAFIKAARNEYLNMLSSRGKHLLEKANLFVKGLGANPQFIHVSHPQDQLLRDFYHDIYYAAFFVGRYALVTEGHFDDSEHKALPTALNTLSLKVQTTDTAKHALLRTTESTIQLLRNHRNMADYVMNAQELGLLASPGTVLSAHTNVSQLYSDWGIV